MTFVTQALAITITTTCKDADGNHGKEVAQEYFSVRSGNANFAIRDACLVHIINYAS